MNGRHQSRRAVTAVRTHSVAEDMDPHRIILSLAARGMSPVERDALFFSGLLRLTITILVLLVIVVAMAKLFLRSSGGHRATKRPSVIGRFFHRARNRLAGIVETPETADESDLFDADKTARRKEIAERWKQGRRPKDD